MVNGFGVKTMERVARIRTISTGAEAITHGRSCEINQISITIVIGEITAKLVLI